MPTLFRLLSYLIFASALVYAIMWSLATFVEPRQTEMTIRVPVDKINPPELPAETLPKPPSSPIQNEQ